MSGAPIIDRSTGLGTEWGAAVDDKSLWASGRPVNIETANDNETLRLEVRELCRKVRRRVEDLGPPTRPQELTELREWDRETLNILFEETGAALGRSKHPLLENAAAGLETFGIGFSTASSLPFAIKRLAEPPPALMARTHFQRDPI